MVLGLAAIGVSPTPARAQLFSKWCNSCSTPTTTTTALLPATANPCLPQTVQYMPQTCYRTQVVCVPVTTYRPACSTNLCTGCQQTTLRPVTTFVQQTRLVPYTSYRLVYSNPCPTACNQTTVAMPIVQRSLFGAYTVPATSVVAMPTGCARCAAPPGPAYVGSPNYNAAVSSAVMPAPSLSPNTSSYAPPAYAPSTSYPPSYPSTYPSASTYQPVPPYSPSNNYQPMPSYQPSPGYTPSSAGGTTNAPALNGNNPPSLATPPSGASPLKTFRDDSAPGSTLKPIPDAGVNQDPQGNSTSTPRLIDPENRVTARPLYPAGSYTPVAWHTDASTEAPQPQGGNVPWRSSSR
jgi:hypothetical protein